MIEIIPFNTYENLAELHRVITLSFKTVADDFGFTEENAPKNPAFRPIADLENMMDSGVDFFAAYENGVMAGCIAIQQNPKDDRMFFLERLAVLPEYRHRGFGKLLLDRASEECKIRGAEVISIGIVDENTELKDWYARSGFAVTGVKKFDHLPFTVCFMEMTL